MERSPFPFEDMDLFDTIPPWWESKTGQVRNWLDLPQEITLHILKNVGVLDILRNVQMVCSAWRDLSKEPCLFTRIIFLDPTQYFSCYDRFKDFITKVVDKSCGQIVEFCSLNYSAYYLLEIISQGHSLKYLKADDGISAWYLRLWAKRFPKLEHLDLSGVWPSLLMEMIQEVGCWCPNLKHLRLHFVYGEDDLEHPQFCLDGVAFAIAKYMPHLHNILLINNTLGNTGLQAILEGCSELEYIGLRKCPHINIHDWLGYGSIFRNKIIDTKVYSEAKGNLDCYLRTKD